MILSSTQYDQVCREAVEDYPNEAVWYLTAQGFRKVANISPQPRDYFQVSRADTLRAMQEGLIAVIHSHPDGNAYPSEADMRSQIATGAIFGVVVSTADSAGDYFEWGGEPEDLMDRPFRHGVTDCWSLIRDYYWSERGTILKDFARSWDWWANGDNLYLDNIEKTGFHLSSLSDVSVSNVVLFSIRSDNPNHGAVYLGDDLILHHVTAQSAFDPTRRPSKEPIYRWQKFITHVFRYAAHD